MFGLSYTIAGYPLLACPQPACPQPATRDPHARKIAIPYVIGYRYIIHSYCLAVQSGLCTNAVEYRILDPADWCVLGRDKMVISSFKMLHLASIVKKK